jgi:hypothetical protein
MKYVPQVTTKHMKFAKKKERKKENMKKHVKQPHPCNGQKARNYLIPM